MIQRCCPNYTVATAAPAEIYQNVFQTHNKISSRYHNDDVKYVGNKSYRWVFYFSNKLSREGQYGLNELSREEKVSSGDSSTPKKLKSLQDTKMSSTRTQ